MHTIDKKAYYTARLSVIGKSREIYGIGTLGERTLHAVLKNYFESDKAKQEIKIGRYHADIYNENGITEIQTRSFNALRNKLEFFLQNNSVTVVYPIHKTKWLVWIDPVTGKATKRRKSPKSGNPFRVFDELYKIKWFLGAPGLKFIIVSLDIEEQRLLDGWSSDGKKGSHRYERIPFELHDEIIIESKHDYLKLLPENLNADFSVKELVQASRVTLKTAQHAVNVLKYIGAIMFAGKRGREYLYRICLD